MLVFFGGDFFSFSKVVTSSVGLQCSSSSSDWQHWVSICSHTYTCKLRIGESKVKFQNLVNCECGCHRNFNTTQESENVVFFTQKNKPWADNTHVR